MLEFQAKFKQSLSVILVAVICAALVSSRVLAADATPAGTTITNQASATYESEGATYGAVFHGVGRRSFDGFTG
jgi:hypothetical protein